MAQYQTVEVERRGRVGIIRLNRPHVLNALSATMLLEWMEALHELNTDPGIGAVVSTGNGRAYCAGADFTNFERQFAGISPWEGQGRPFNRPFDPDYLSTSKPIIGAINGLAIGAGVTSILWFDVNLASTAARFSMRFVAIGVTPELNGQWILPRIIGLQNAKEMMLTGKIYGAEEARDLGLVRRVVEPEQLLPEAVALADEIAANPPTVLRALKRLVYEDLVSARMREAFQRSDATFAETRMEPAHREGVTAFREKRPPRYHDAEQMQKAAIMLTQANADLQKSSSELQ